MDEIDQLESWLQKVVVDWCECLRDDLDEGTIDPMTFRELQLNFVENADLMLDRC